MLLKMSILQKIAAGEIQLAFRRWKRPSVRGGGTLKTAIGVLAIESVRTISESRITNEEARRAGYASRAELLDELNARDGDLYRVEVRYAGADPRVALRESAALGAAEVTELRRRLDRFDAASRAKPWTRAVLRLIESRPATLAATLAEELCQEKLAFKRNVRKLKELGLTESLEIGYRLSPRGRALLKRL
jgi:hypothetical protein